MTSRDIHSMPIDGTVQQALTPIRVGSWWYCHRSDLDQQNMNFFRFPIRRGDGWHTVIQSDDQMLHADRFLRICCNFTSQDGGRYQSFQIGLAGKTGVLVTKRFREEHYTLHIVNLFTGAIITSLQRCGSPVGISPDDSYVYYTAVTDAGAIRQIRKRRVGGGFEDLPVMDIDPSHWPTVRTTISREYLFIRDAAKCTVIRLDTAARRGRLVHGCRQLAAVNDFEHLHTTQGDSFVGYGVDRQNNTGVIIIPDEDAIAHGDQWFWSPIKFGIIHRLTIAAQRSIVVLTRSGQSQEIRATMCSNPAEGIGSHWESLRINRSIHCGELSMMRSADPCCNVIGYRLECPACPPTTWYTDIPENNSQDIQPIVPTQQVIRDMDHSISFHTIQGKHPRCDIPVTVITPTCTQTEGETAKVALFVYGCYGLTLPLTYDVMIAELVKHGIYAVYAHVRGGGERGQSWHAAGQRTRKIVTVNDYLAVASSVGTLINRDRPRIIGVGTSAGGTIVAAALNMMPSVFAGALLSEPFISPLRAVYNQTNPRKKTDISEFGDPDDIDDLNALKKWSPLENVKNQSYPPMMIALNEYDRNIDNEEAIEYADKLKSFGAEVQLTIRKNASHTMHNMMGSELEEVRWINEL